MVEDFSGLSLVPGVLSGCSRAQIGLSIVQRITVDMVDKHIVGDLQDFSVHPDYLSFLAFAARAAAFAVYSHALRSFYLYS